MRIQDTAESGINTNQVLIETCLPIGVGERVLELGCGAAETTRALAEAHPGAAIIATEVDRIQHEKNLQISDLPNVTFRLGGAQDIELPDSSVHDVILLKSLHHVPRELLDHSLTEIHRVLVPGGLAYVSEPIYAGAFNDILRLFHDEQAVRQAAFDAIERAVASGMFELVEEIFFRERRRYEGFAEFEDQVLNVTHTQMDVDEALHAKIRRAFEAKADAVGAVAFDTPQRVDLLRKPAG